MMNDAIIYGTATFCNALVEGHLTIGTNSNNAYAFTNIQDSNLNNIPGALLVDNNLYVGGRIFCNGIEWSAMDSMMMNDATVYGTMTFCNTHIDGLLTIGTSLEQPYAFSNIQDSNLNEVQGALLVDNNLYVGGRIFCNGIQWSAMESMILDDAIIQGTMTLCNARVQGGVSFGNDGNYRAFSNITNEKVNEVTGALLVEEDIYIGGRIFCNGFSMTATNIFEATANTLTLTSNITLSYGPSNPKWMMQLENSGSDLVFKSVNNTTVVISDTFASSVLNFTGQHLVNVTGRLQRDIFRNLQEYVGTIVVSKGIYNTLSIDDAVPNVDLSRKSKDSRVFGVISDIENTDDKRSFKIGNLQFIQEKSVFDVKVKVNALGEGGLWVCNYNGNLKNGDLITTCSIPGYGTKQKHKAVLSYTVAKITCDCAFDLHSTNYTCEEFSYNGKKYRKAFVGVVYKC